MKIYTLENQFQTIRFLDYGATIYEWLAFSDKRNIILNNLDLEVYRGPRTGFFGATLGRVANRIKDGRFTIGEKMYQLSTTFKGGHHGHGGPTGISFMTFDVVSQSDDQIHFRVLSHDMHEGYPGNLVLDVVYTLDNRSLIVDYYAKVDKASPVNISNHVHFNLSNESTILNHTLKINANRYIETDEDGIPTGKLLPVANTRLDFREEKLLSEGIMDSGIDHALVFNKKELGVVTLRYQNYSLKLETEYPCIQVYTMNNPLSQKLKNGSSINKYHGVALEPQFEIDAVNHPNFSNIILEPTSIYHKRNTYTLSEKSVVK